MAKTDIRLSQFQCMNVLKNLKYIRGSLPPKFEHVNKFEAGLAFRYNAPY
jgi:hypothetical protein